MDPKNKDPDDVDVEKQKKKKSLDHNSRLFQMRKLVNKKTNITWKQITNNSPRKASLSGRT